MVQVLGEAVEVAGPAGTDLTGWSVVPYNGNGGAPYSPQGSLTGRLADDTGTGFGFQSVSLSGLQNGAPDGVALVDAAGDLVQFLSYEGTFTAVGGAADGRTSTDIGVAEDGKPPELLPPRDRSFHVKRSRVVVIRPSACSIPG